MNSRKKLAAIATLLTIVMTTSLFADNRRQETTDGWRGRSHDSRRVTVEGRIRDIDRDRNGFVIRLDRGGYTIVADAQTHGLRRLERGDDIRVTGTVDRGRLYVDRISLLREEDNRRDADDRYLRGTVIAICAAPCSR
jgi:hypothetical protein